MPECITFVLSITSAPALVGCGWFKQVWPSLMNMANSIKNSMACHITSCLDLEKKRLCDTGCVDQSSL